MSIDEVLTPGLSTITVASRTGCSLASSITVVIAADGAEARDRLGEGTYQLVLLDVMMPELTGYQVLPIARQLQPDAKVMLMSGYSEHTRRAGRDEEPDSFLEKPFTAKVLDHAIDDLLGKR